MNIKSNDFTNEELLEIGSNLEKDSLFMTYHSNRNMSIREILESSIKEIAKCEFKSYFGTIIEKGEEFYAIIYFDESIGAGGIPTIDLSPVNISKKDIDKLEKEWAPSLTNNFNNSNRPVIFYDKDSSTQSKLNEAYEYKSNIYDKYLKLKNKGN